MQKSEIKQRALCEHLKGIEEQIKQHATIWEAEKTKILETIYELQNEKIKSIYNLQS